ncbi:hypothetical protein ACOMHN_049927 [Nucella lapillus]
MTEMMFKLNNMDCSLSKKLDGVREDVRQLRQDFTALHGLVTDLARTTKQQQEQQKQQQEQQNNSKNNKNNSKNNKNNSKNKNINKCKMSGKQTTWIPQLRSDTVSKQSDRETSAGDHSKTQTASSLTEKRQPVTTARHRQQAV